MLAVVFITFGWVIIAGLFTFSPAQAFEFPPAAFTLDRQLIMSVGAASVLAMYSYGGYNQVCNIGGEITAPEKTIPRSIFVSLFLVAALYMLMTIVILGMIPWQEVKESRTIASEFIARTFSDPATGRIAGIVMTGLILRRRRLTTPPSSATRASRTPLPAMATSSRSSRTCIRPSSFPTSR